MFSRGLVIRVCLVAGLLFCMYSAARRGIAAWYFRKKTPEAIQTAIRWDPSNPAYYDALGNLTHLYADSGNSETIIRDFETATRLSPHSAQYWADLGSAYEWAGRTNDALRALNRAHELFPNSPYINWRLANFYVRTHNTPEALHALRSVLLAGGVPQSDVFTLAANAAPGTAAILDDLLPPSADFLFDYLNFRVVARDAATATEVWRRIVKLNLPFDSRQAFPYLDALIREHELDSLTDAWSLLAARFPSEIRTRISPQNAIVNGSFEFEPLDGALDWRILPGKGAKVSLDSQQFSGGARSLRIDFDGTQNLDFGGVFQYVLVEPGTRYRFSGDMRVEGITTDSGPQFEIFDAYNMAKLDVSTESLTGTSAWTPRQFDFKTNRDTRLLIVRVARPASRKFDNKISGTVWLDRLSLQPTTR